MIEHIKKRAGRSPNYPIQTLEWAVNTALELLEKEGEHAMPPDILAINLGYKDASNGKAGRVLANLKAFGVIDSVAGGKLAVTKDVQRYKLTPTAEDKKSYLKQWFKKPLLYRKLIEKYDRDLPSDAVLLFELVDEHGFNEAAARKAIKVFRDSLNFVMGNANSHDSLNGVNDEGGENEEEDIAPQETTINQQIKKPVETASTPSNFHPSEIPPAPQVQSSQESIKYPIRLAGGRMAWIEVPVPFYEADKNKLRAQIEIIGTEDEDNKLGGFDM